MLPNRSTDLGLPSFSSDREMDESGKEWGRKDRRIETRDEEDAGEWWRHKKNNEHIGNCNQKEPTFLSKTTSSLSSYIRFFYSVCRFWRRDKMGGK